MARICGSIEASRGGHRLDAGVENRERAGGELSVVLDGALINREELHKALGAPRGEEDDAALLARAYRRWDKDLVKHLRGPFALALWDGRKQRLLLARDRFGERPLYLQEKGGTLSFASAAAALPSATVDAAAARAYFATGRLAPGTTLLAGVRALPAGSYATWQFGRLHEVKYWAPPDSLPQGEPRKEDAVRAFVERLDEAVRLRMAGPSAGVLLSAGFDSAAIAALMKRHSERVASFSAGIEGDPRGELAAAASAAKHFGTQHHEIVVAPRELIARLPEAVAARGAPVERPSEVVLHLVAAQAARAVGAVLAGSGADEILGGYRRYAMPGALGNLRRELSRDQASLPPPPLESHAPFLDHRVAEHVSQLPDGERVSGIGTKRILRKAAALLIPGGEVAPRKGGMRIALRALIAGEMKEFVVEHLRAARSLARTVMDAGDLERSIGEHLAGRKNNERQLWTLLNLEIWHRSHLAAAHRG